MMTRAKAAQCGHHEASPVFPQFLFGTACRLRQLSSKRKSSREGWEEDEGRFAGIPSSPFYTSRDIFPSSLSPVEGARARRCEKPLILAYIIDLRIGVVLADARRFQAAIWTGNEFVTVMGLFNQEVAQPLAQRRRS